jgi:hypothetical protein
MNDRRFLTILNEVAAELETGLLDASPGRRESEAIQAWAGFLRSCVERGVSVGDPRWRLLEIRRTAGRPRFALPEADRPAAAEAESDFGVGLALLMAMLTRGDTE